jgi:FtsP/CotA-like multicopper oxidase with cupredoxin domain
MRAKVKKRIQQIILFVGVGLIAATVQTVVWAAKSPPKTDRAAQHARSSVVVAGGHARVQARRKLRRIHPARVSPDVGILLVSPVEAATGSPVVSPAGPGSSKAAAPISSAAPAAAPDRTIDLCAKAGNATLVGSASVPIWGFVLKGSAADCSDVAAQLPGPQLDVNEGELVLVNVTNALDRPIAIEVPGIDFAPGPSEAASGETVSLTFTASSPGTYLYESGAQAGRQEAMGLYGALVVHPALSGVEYGSAFDLERTLVLSEVDPDLNAAPDTFDMNAWKPKYWLINGKAYPDTASIGVAAGQRLLLRYANAGTDNHTMMLLGLHERLIGRDDFAIADPFDVVSQTFSSGQTADAIVEIPAGASGQMYPLYNRNLDLRNGPFGGPGSTDQGGMMLFINVS